MTMFVSVVVMMMVMFTSPLNFTVQRGRESGATGPKVRRGNSGNATSHQLYMYRKRYVEEFLQLKCEPRDRSLSAA